MENNMEAPERIWANGIGVYGEYEGFGGVEYIRADLAAPSAQPVRLGAGSWVVVTGTYDESPALFIEPSKTPGKVGESAEREGIPRDRLIPGAMVMTFPTAEQARAVADAICCPAPSAPAEVEGLVLPEVYAACGRCEENGEDECVRRLHDLRHDGEMWSCEDCWNPDESDKWDDAPKLATALTALQAENERLRGERQALAEAICGGEDFPGLLAATSVDALVDTARKEHRCHHETIDARLKAEAAIARLSAELEARDQQIVDLLDTTVTCACGYDSPDDVCMKHMPMFKRLTAERDAIAAAAYECAAQVARDCYPDPQAESDPGYIPKAIRALATEAETTALAEIVKKAVVAETRDMRKALEDILKAHESGWPDKQDWGAGDRARAILSRLYQPREESEK